MLTIHEVGGLAGAWCGRSSRVAVRSLLAGLFTGRLGCCLEIKKEKRTTIIHETRADVRLLLQPDSNPKNLIGVANIHRH